MTHFGDKSAFEHIVEKKKEGEQAFQEHHGEGAPESVARGADGAREMALFLLLAATFFSILSLDKELFLLMAIALGWATWKVCRTAWLGWSRLERLHRLIEQEKYEIEHHRPQEKEELVVLYRSKGFEGELLQEVVEVLMADQDRLLKVMLEEEMGLTLEAYDHPLKQSLGTALGSLASACIVLGAYYAYSWVGIVIASLVVIGFGAGITAYMEKNRVIPAVVWNIAIAILAFGVSYFFLEGVYKF